jgi:hypothetical protein
MKTVNFLGVIGAALSVALALSGCGGNAKQAEAENEALRAEVAALRARTNDLADAEAREAELKRLQAETKELARLRAEVTQLRNATKEGEKLRAENQQLKSENQKLRGATASTPNPPPAQAAQPGTFPREAWTFAGYTSPEAALISAIWSMQQGNPKQYFESLTPEEQLRMSKAWEGKSQTDIAAKHQNDTAAITGLRVIESSPMSADETVTMKVMIEGVNREELVRMKRVGGDWKFGGFIREPKQ